MQPPPATTTTPKTPKPRVKATGPKKADGFVKVTRRDNAKRPAKRENLRLPSAGEGVVGRIEHYLADMFKSKSRRPATVPHGTARNENPRPPRPIPSKNPKVPKLTKPPTTLFSPIRNPHLQLTAANPLREPLTAAKTTLVEAALEHLTAANFTQEGVHNSPSHYEQRSPTFATRTVGGHEILSLRNNSYMDPLTIPPTSGAVLGLGVSDIFSIDVSVTNTDLFPEYIRELSQIFVYYNVAHLTVKWNPSVSSISEGQIAVAYLPDPTTPTPSDLRTLMNIHGAAFSRASETREWRIPLLRQTELKSVGSGVDYTRNSTEFLTDEVLSSAAGMDPRLSSLGKLLFATTGFVNGSAFPIIIGNITLEWTLEFVGIAPRESAASCAIQVIGPNVTTWGPTRVAWASPPRGLGVYPLNSPSAGPATKQLQLAFSRPGTYRCDMAIWGTGFGAASTYGAMCASGALGAGIPSVPGIPMEVSTTWWWTDSPLVGPNESTSLANRATDLCFCSFYVRVNDDDFLLCLGPNKAVTSITTLYLNFTEVNENAMAQVFGTPSIPAPKRWFVADYVASA